MYASGRNTYLRAFAAGLKPDPDLTVTQWARNDRYLGSDEGPVPGKWSDDLVPFLPEITDCLSPSHPCREVTFCKSAQVAGSAGGLNFLGAIIDAFPAPTLVVLPTVDTAKSYATKKLQPMLDNTPSLKGKVVEQKQRRGGSTMTDKKFPGGFLRITGANSSAGLQMLSVRFVIKEELSEWPDQIESRGDPDTQVDKRQTAYSATRKTFNVSTPGLAGTCRITKKFEAGDQRRYYVPCPECGHYQILEFEHLKHNDEPPYEAYYLCQSGNGCIIQHHHKTAMLAAGRWIAHAPGEGREPSFHLHQLYSPFVSWDDTVAEKKKAEAGGPRDMKVYVQQVRGEAYEEKGDVPDYALLLARREPYEPRTLPYGSLFLTAGVDVGHHYLVYEVVAWGPGRASWSVDHGILQGDTKLPEVWAALDEILDRAYPDSVGRGHYILKAAVDSGDGNRAIDVYRYCRSRPKALAIKGMPGWQKPIIGTPSRVDVDENGRKWAGGAMVWPVGTWEIKTDFYAVLGRKGTPSAGQFEPGYCHFHNGCDEPFFKQLTAEALVINKKGQHEWKPFGENHFHDARIYAIAAAASLGLYNLTDEQWAAMVIAHNDLPKPTQADLFVQALTPVLAVPTIAPPSPPPAQSPAPPSPPRSGFSLSRGFGRS